MTPTELSVYEGLMRLVHNPVGEITINFPGLTVVLKTMEDKREFMALLRRNLQAR